MTNGRDQEPSTAKVHPRRLDFLDAMRGLAAVYVVVYHMIFLSSPNLAVPAWARLVAFNGGAGVILFFVISAFSLFYTMPARLSERRPWLSYALHRLFRIAPLFYVWIVLTIVRDHLVYGASHSWWAIAASGSFLFNFVPGAQEGFVWASWTIGVEMLFYVAFPFIFARVRNLWSALALLVGCILLWMFCQVIIDYLAISPAAAASLRQWSFFRFLPEFSMGVVAYYVIRRALTWSEERPEAARGLGLLLVLLAGYVYIAILQGVGYLGLPDPRYAQAVCCLLVLAGLSLRSVSLLVNRLTVYLGKISYSVYLNHPTLVFFLVPVYKKIYGHTDNVSLAFVSCCLLTYAILIPLSALTYALIERPGIRWGKRCYAWLDSRLGPRNAARLPQAG